MGEWIKNKWVKRGVIILIATILQNISNRVFDWSWDYLLTSTIILSFSDLIFIVGITVSGIFIFIISGKWGLKLPTEKMREIEKIDGVNAYVFFPVETPDENRTLNYHSKYLHKRLIVNLKTEPPKAYFMTASKDSYGWQLIKKYSSMWVSELHYDLENKYFTKQWCKAKGYTLIERVASKEDLLDKN